ncbi:hypothetical protein Trydic_g7074 [Trypoxylus dichotomus]
MNVSDSELGGDHRSTVDSGDGPVVKEGKPGSTWKTSRTQEDTQMPPASSRMEDIGRGRTEVESPAN